MALQWRHNGHDGVSNHQSRDCLLNRLFKAQIKKTWKLRVTDLFERNSPVTGEFPVQRASNAENVSIWWRHHGLELCTVHMLMPHFKYLMTSLPFKSLISYVPGSVLFVFQPFFYLFILFLFFVFLFFCLFVWVFLCFFFFFFFWGGGGYF